MTQAPHQGNLQGNLWPEQNGRGDVDRTTPNPSTQANFAPSTERFDNEKKWYKTAWAKLGAAAAGVVLVAGVSSLITNAAHNNEAGTSRGGDPIAEGPQVPGPLTSETEAPVSTTVNSGEIDYGEMNKNLPNKRDIPPVSELSSLDEELANPELTLDQVRKKMTVGIQSHLNAGDAKGAAFYILGLQVIEGKRVIDPSAAEAIAVNHWSQTTMLADLPEAQASEKGVGLQLDAAKSGIPGGIYSVIDAKNGQKLSFTVNPQEFTETVQPPNFPPETFHWRGSFVFVPDSPNNSKVGSWKLLLTDAAYKSKTITSK